ncbi:MAG: hypothetical protein HEQ17_00585 [Limnohabitans sp.]|jgi:hypothetical protein|uniref:hypothetical protein n=1 Tax=Limnohabitans sp. TaxID=1907725 RepID=UPI0025F82748|nr:hypothetical protein [Limnohabitans sp.]MCO4087509.1 hypothetical protein [Limnohabitans sp.]
MQSNLAVIPTQISLLGVDEATERHQAIMAHAISVVQNYAAMKESAARLCVSLFACHSEFKQSGEVGWENFCAVNFAPLGLSQGNIRSAIKAGRAISHYLSSLQSRGETAEIKQLETMSRSALIVLGEAPDDVRDQLIDRVVQANEMMGSAMPARGVSSELERIQRERDQANEDLRTAEGRLTQAGTATQRLNDLVRDRESQIEEQQTKIDELSNRLRELSNAPKVEVLEPNPNSRADLEARRNLEQQLSDLNHQVSVASADLSAHKSELEKISRQASLRKQTDNAMGELEQQVTRLKAQWSDAYAQKIRATDPHQYGPVLSRIANDMRLLADQLDPTLC